jgi:hypothetical protein
MFVGKSTFENLPLLFLEGHEKETLQQCGQRCGILAAQTNAFMDIVLELDIPVFVLELESNATTQTLKNCRLLEREFKKRGRAIRTVEISGADVGIPYGKSAAYMIGLSPARFNTDQDGATSWLDRMLGFLERQCDILSRSSIADAVYLPFSKFLLRDECDQVMAARKEILAKAVKPAPIPGQLFQKMADAGLSPSQCQPPSAFLESPWQDAFTDKDRAVLGIIHHTTPAVVATDLSSGAPSLATKEFFGGRTTN